ncbi:MAG TPA: NUDIX domain-containing protein [Candidatus Caldiarchaeum subterraneum]|uniref:Bis(5'-nucleosyl)-tetraphosphatase [asymmetrical] n=1 Tax=Caldiarchaeum subterraneum TaxID=311458 RepID=A0A832ZX12_CALS0|nr:NUDIX domain-containing protein [Aigarchaeota archaeon]HIQ30415.1 NUDIX domain-containing protein [Candidatus Caldarchaeum subterraneum]
MGLIKEKSAGAVVFYDNGQEPEYLLLLYEAGHWDFPKGGIEEGETEIQTALREVKEETGLNNVKIIDGFKWEIQYNYRKNRNLVRKTVVFFLAESETKDVTLSYEHKDYTWLPYEEAYSKLTFKTAKETLKEAHVYLIKVKNKQQRLDGL